jgi:hypothetical protein
VLLADGQHELDFHLPLGEISGRLVTGEGEGVGSVHVVALREDGYLDQLLPFDDGAVKTGSDGRFRITLLSDGTYTLMAYGRRAWKSRSGIRIAGDTVTGIELTLLPSGSVQGHVYDAEHRPVDDAVVFARDAGGKLLWGHKDDTNSKGEFRFAVPAGTVTLFARMWGAAAPDTAPLTVRAGERTVGIEIFIAPAARLWVTTLVDDVPTPATVRVYNEEGREVSRAQVDLEGMAGALRDPLSATSRAVGPLPAGRYQVVATSLAGRATQEYVNLGSEDVEVALRLK